MITLDIHIDNVLREQYNGHLNSLIAKRCTSIIFKTEQDKNWFLLRWS